MAREKKSYRLPSLMTITVEVKEEHGLLQWKVEGDPVVDQALVEAAKRRLILKHGRSSSLIFTAGERKDEVFVRVASGPGRGVLWFKTPEDGRLIKGMVARYYEALKLVRNEVDISAREYLLQAALAKERRRAEVPSVTAGAMRIFRDPAATFAVRHFPEVAVSLELFIRGRVLQRVDAVTPNAA